jgi:hypothetical protein
VAYDVTPGIKTDINRATGIAHGVKSLQKTADFCAQYKSLDGIENMLNVNTILYGVEAACYVAAGILLTAYIAAAIVADGSTVKQIATGTIMLALDVVSMIFSTYVLVEQ